MSATFDQAIRYSFVFIGYRSTQVYKKRFLNKYEPINKVNICSFLLITRSFIALIFISDFMKEDSRQISYCPHGERKEKMVMQSFINCMKGEMPNFKDLPTKSSRFVSMYLCWDGKTGFNPMSDNDVTL